MSLELRKGRDGLLIRKWYGRYMIRGQRYSVALGPVRGTPPESGAVKDPGDDVFERSREAAAAKLEHLIEEARRPQDAAALVERIYEIKTGTTLKAVKLEDLAAEWLAIPRRRTPNARYAAQCQVVLRRFVAFVKAGWPRVTELPGVTKEIAQAFMKAEEARGITNKTWNDSLKLLRATCKYLLPNGAINPFDAQPTRETDTVFRKPFTPQELGRILEEAKKDTMLFPVIVAGVCTAMRRGDCCLLKWKDVDLAGGFLTVKTSKTGETVEIPIFGMLAQVLSAIRKKAGKSEFCFPEAAAMYQSNPDGISWRVKKILVRAFSDDEAEEAGLPTLPEAETRARCLAYLDGLPSSEKVERMRSVFLMYMDKASNLAIQDGCGVSKGSISGYLTAVEAGAKCRVVRGRTSKRSVSARARTDRELLHQDREDGTRRASVRDFHSFRVTWVTLALTAGMPLELVQKVTGHKTTEIVLKHYFRPGREDFRAALEGAMPQLMMGRRPEAEGDGRLKLGVGGRRPEDELAALAAKLAAGSATAAEKARLRELAAGVA